MNDYFLDGLFSPLDIVPGLGFLVKKIGEKMEARR
jgi:hypothetical protein